MPNDPRPLKALFVADGSGGHVIPALETAAALAQTGADVQVWYAQRPHSDGWAQALAREIAGPRVAVAPIPMRSQPRLLDRLRESRQLWSRAARCFASFSPDVVVGFGGWISAPVVLAARLHRIKCVIHEQNVVMGRANRWLARWVDRVAVTFPQAADSGVVQTGLPVRSQIGTPSRAEAAASFGLEASRPILLVVGGSQGARAVNRIVVEGLARASEEERHGWQVLHLAGAADEAMVRLAYAHQRITSRVAAFLTRMADAYAAADLVIARAGASTIAEVARCGLPAILIPYPHAGGHQRENARVVAGLGGGMMIEESALAPALLLQAVRRVLGDAQTRDAMRARIRTLAVPDAAARLTSEILEVAGVGAAS